MDGKHLTLWRKKWGIPQGELARLLGTYQVTVCRWEKGARKTPFLLPLALEALENRFKMEVMHGSAS
jgi:DNA-binding transcriptional regulator YiaG